MTDNPVYQYHLYIHVKKHRLSDQVCVFFLYFLCYIFFVIFSVVLVLYFLLG